MAEQNREGELLLDPTIAGKKGVFLLRVKGDSMIGAHIQDGDLVVVEENPSPENGDIVVALIDDETTMKRFFLEEGKVRLQPENPNMPPIFIGEGKTRVGIIGKVVGLLRKY
jgi:repressor LexA